MKDPDDFSDQGSDDDSEFEAIEDESDDKKEQHLKNDKYDLVLEVSASASIDGDDPEDGNSSSRETSRESPSVDYKIDVDTKVGTAEKSGDNSKKSMARKREPAASREQGRDQKTGEDVKNDQFDAAYDLSSADDESSVDSREAAELTASKKVTIGALSTSGRLPLMSSVTGVTTSSVVASAVAGLSSSAMRAKAGGIGASSDGSESGSESSSNEDGRSSALKVEGAYDPADYAHLDVSVEIKDLFQYIGRYKAHEVDLDTSLHCFIPDFIPAVGDTDAFLKMPRPDDAPDELGLKVLDEPSVSQSDATVLELQLKAICKKQHGDLAVRSIENARKNPAEIEKWIQNVNDVHRTKPPPQVIYKKTMPDVDVLMEAWPPEIEEMIGNVRDISPEIDMPLEDYAGMICALMDIPVYDNIIESLHVLFTTFMEFKSNAHFVQLGAAGAREVSESVDFGYK